MPPHILVASIRSSAGSTGFDLGVAYVAGALSEAGIDYFLVDSPDLDRGRAAIRAFLEACPGPGLALFGGMLGNRNYLTLKELFRDIKQARPDIRIFLGGPMATFGADVVARHFPVDGLVLGDGHETAAELARAFRDGADPARVPGLLLRSPKGFRATPQRPVSNKLRFPRIPWERFDMRHYVEELRANGRAFNIVGSKGCYSRCRYCVRSDKTMRFREPDAILAELTEIHDRLGLTRFNFVDDNYLNSPKFIKGLANGLATLPFPVEFLFQGRVDRVTEEALGQLREVGLRQISFGIESADQRILDEMQKGTKTEDARRALALCRRLGVGYHASFIVGMPSEDDASIQADLDFLREEGFVANYNVGFLTLLPGTPLYDQAVREGRITDEDLYLENLTDVYQKPYTNLTRYDDTWLIEARDRLLASKRAHLSRETSRPTRSGT